MKKILMLVIAAGLFFTSCKKDEEEPDLGEEISGTYAMKTYETDKGVSKGDLSNNKIRVTRVDDTHAKIVIDYADSKTSDVTSDNVNIEKSGDKYNYNQTFSNAKVTGNVDGNTISFDIRYNDGDYAVTTGVK